MINKQKKVAIVYSGAKHWGGVETYLELLFANADNAKVDLTLLSLGDWPLTSKVKSEIFSASRINPMAVLQIAKYLRKNEFDLVVSQGTVANFYARLASMYSGVPSLVVAHSDAYYDYPNPVVRFIYAVIERLTRFSTKYYIAVSEYLKQKLVVSGIPSDKISVVYNGVSLDSKFQIPNSIFNKPQLVIGSIGRLHKVKNYDELIRACAELKISNFKLQIAGEGSEHRNLERLISDLNLSEKVELLGNVENVHELLESWDIYVQPSLSEGFGLTVVEAILAGKPVIVSPRGALLELVKDGETGIVMDGTAKEDIVKAINNLISDPEKAKKLALAGQKSAKEKFGVDKWIKSTEDAFIEAAK